SVMMKDWQQAFGRGSRPGGQESEIEGFVRGVDAPSASDEPARKFAESENLKSADEHTFRSVIDFLPQLVWISDVEGHIGFVNSQWTVYTGIPQQELLGMNWRDCME